MAQIFLGVFFSLAALGALALIVAMLRSEWDRVAAILTGAELASARASAARVRIRQRAWGRPELRPVPQRRAAAA
jgi:UDP-N-acetylmuramyl pentapeptide phosphotransferase/UDP-N-acetylglucosamine-1-phosphate transferase